jgi:signal transduction histidine kinase
LLSNAVKYTKEGYVRITVRRNLDEGIAIIVEDTGVGISQDNLKTLFSTFNKIDDDRELNIEGVGLGLTISKDLARALGGDISVSSVRGLGTTFTISLPNI